MRPLPSTFFLCDILVFTFFFSGCTKLTFGPDQKQPSASIPPFRILLENTKSSTPPNEITLLTGAGLTRVDLDTGRSELSLLKSYETVSPNEVRLVLHEGIKWSNGTKLTSDDIVNSWKRALSLSVDAQRFLSSIKNLKAYLANKIPWESVGIRAKDPNTLEILFETPCPSFITFLSHPSLWPNKEKEGLFLGKYTLVKNEGRSWELKQNPHSFLPQGYYPTIRISLEASEDTRAIAFHENATDFTENISVSLAGTLGLTPQLVPDYQFSLLEFVGLPNPELRQLFAKAIDRNELSRMIGSQTLPACDTPPLFRCTDTAPALPSEAAIHATFAKANLFIPQAPRLRLAAESDNGLADQALNLQVQWLKRLGLKIDIEAAPESTQFRLRKTVWSPYEAQRSSGKVTDSTEVYLQQEQRSILVRSGLKGIRRHPIGAWDFVESRGDG